MNVLVTGSDGQLGSALRHESLNSSCNWLFTSKTGGKYPLDITDALSVEAFVREHDVDVLINCAAYTDVEKAETDEEGAMSVNCTGVAALASAALNTGALLVHISTDYVFDGQSSLPYVETDPVNPVNVYGRSKAAGENAILSSGCRHMIFRTSWMYYQTGRNFVSRMLELAASKPVLSVVSDQVGSPTYAADLAQLLVSIIDEGKLRDGGIWHYSNEGVCSWYDFAREICSVSGYLCEVMPCKSSEYRTKAMRPMYSVMDKSKVKKDFGVDIPHWSDSLSICLDIML